jgi:hypothetical protein
LEGDGLIVQTREVGGSRFFRLATSNPKVVAMLQTDFRQINDELAADRFGKLSVKGRIRPTVESPRSRRTPRSKAVPASR